MSDTVKLIIEIPKHLYDVIKNKECTSKNVITTAVENGTPLDDVKAEIREQQKEYQEWGWAYDDVLEILDNIGKSCNTCKNNDDEFSGECYECVKNIQNHYEPERSEPNE